MWEEASKEPWYGTEFKTSKIMNSLLETLQGIENGTVHVENFEELSLPDENIFIPENFKVPISPAVQEPLKQPKLLLSEGRINLCINLMIPLNSPNLKLVYSSVRPC